MSYTHFRYWGPAAVAALALVGCAAPEAKNVGRATAPVATSGTATPPKKLTAPKAETPKAIERPLGTKDWTVSIRVTKKHCFSGYGCNVNWEPTLNYVGPENLKPEDGESWEITYIMNGLTDPYSDTLVSNGLTFEKPFMSGSGTTPKASTKVTASVTSVIEN